MLLSAFDGDFCIFGRRRLSAAGLGAVPSELEKYSRASANFSASVKDVWSKGWELSGKGSSVTVLRGGMTSIKSSHSQWFAEFVILKDETVVISYETKPVYIYMSRKK